MFQLLLKKKRNVKTRKKKTSLRVSTWVKNLKNSCRHGRTIG